jgi:hypothetical protein
MLVEYVLAVAMSVLPGAGGACPDDWPGPWTACPEAAWVGRVAETAGYRLAGDTGSALVAEGGGDSFYIWATQHDRPFSELAADERWKPLARVDDVPVYGDRTLWRWWPAQGFVFWLQAGPRAKSTLPPVDGMDGLISASQTVRQP